MSWIKGLIALSLVTLVACGHDEKKQAEDLQSEGQSLINEVNANEDAKMAKGINIYGLSETNSADAYPWAAIYPRAEDRAQLRKELVDHISKLNRILEIGHHKNMKLEGESKIVNSRKQAQAYIDSLDRFENAKPEEAAPLAAPSKHKKKSAR